MSLLENLLFWAKSQMKKIDVKKTSIEVQSFVLECEEALISSAERKQIKIEHDFQATFSLEIDVEMMNVVLRNLLSNAIKFSYPGKKIVIRCFEEAELKCISIIDEGTGIHPEVLNMILSDQEIAPSNGTRKEPGTGLGLIIARDFTEKNGGVIKVKSTPGKGTTFSICFPV
jgi:signal transduction histidine kinase